jgi:hypothetical protein
MALSKPALATSAGRPATSSSKASTAKAIRLPTCAGQRARSKLSVRLGNPRRTVQILPHLHMDRGCMGIDTADVSIALRRVLLVEGVERHLR